MILLGLNIDHSATVRPARYRAFDTSVGGMIEPDPMALDLEAERVQAVHAMKSRVIS